MRIFLVAAATCLAVAAASACSDTATNTAKPDAQAADAADGGSYAAQQQQILAVPQSGAWSLPGLEDTVQVVRTESGVPHIYAKNRRDLMRVQGFLVGRDRLFMLDLARRLGTGRLAELMGDAVLGADETSRVHGMTAHAERTLASLTAVQLSEFDAFAGGVNAAIAAVAAGTLPPPSEIKAAFGLLGYKSPAEMLKPFDRRDIAAIATVAAFNQGFETTDVERAKVLSMLDKAFAGQPDAELRRQGAVTDLFERVKPAVIQSSTPGFGSNGDQPPPPPPPATSQPSAKQRADLQVPIDLLQRLDATLATFQRHLGHPRRGERGSNVWAVSGKLTQDGASLLASDGHLSLVVPTLFYQLGFDDRVFGGGDTHELGLVLPGAPILACGTNGDIAWSQTYFYGDVTDWYREEIQLDDKGLPSQSRFSGEWKPLKRFDEVYLIANVPLLGSKGRTDVWPRWHTFDDRRIVEIEGRALKEGEAAGAKESVIHLAGKAVVPGDTDGDGKVIAISMRLTTFDAGDTLGAVDGFAHAKTVQEIRLKMRGLVGHSQNVTAIDQQGGMFYSAYNASPCRGYLERDKDGHFAAGADPRLLLDGTKYGAFHIPIKDGVVDETRGKTDPYACVVPFDQWPQALNPPEGFVLNANNDPAGLGDDGRLDNDAWYLGGPWSIGLRAANIADALKKIALDKSASEQAMADVQGSHRSRYGELLGPVLLDAMARAQSGGADEASKRLAAILAPRFDAFDEAIKRLNAWKDAGFPAESGVATFYHKPDEAERKNAIATMIFNAWVVELMHRLYDGAAMPVDPDRLNTALPDLFAGRGPDNPKSLASWNPKTQESVFFDLPNTATVETSREVVLLALGDALDRLAAKPEDAGRGGFGTADMNQWLWGLRHWLRLDSILADYLGDMPGLSALTDPFSINPDVLPLADALAPGDPRIGLPGFPRPGDLDTIDTAGPHALRDAKFPDTNVRDFSYNHGPNMRMVIALGKGNVSGRNILPGGQSALNDSPNFADQARKWLGNETLPMRFAVADVVAGAIGREVFTPQK